MTTRYIRPRGTSADLARYTFVDALRLSTGLARVARWLADRKLTLPGAEQAAARRLFETALTHVRPETTVRELREALAEDARILRETEHCTACLEGGLRSALRDDGRCLTCGRDAGIARCQECRKFSRSTMDVATPEGRLTICLECAVNLASLVPEVRKAWRGK